MQFDPNSFMDVETTEKAERRTPLPVGDYMSMIKDVTTKPWSNDKGQSGISVLVQHEVQVPGNLVEELKYRSPTLLFTDRLFLDLTEGGTIDWAPGANGGLRRYREALDMNKAGEAFSLRRMISRPIKLRINHEMYQGEVQERIGGVTKAV